MRRPARLLAAFLLVAMPALAQPQNGGGVGAYGQDHPVLGPNAWGGGPVSTSTVTATGGTTTRTLANWLGDAINAVGQGADSTGVSASDTALTSAISVALSRGVPTEIYLPCGIYKVSQAQSITTTGNQGIWLHGASSSCVTINQTADADVFDVSLQNYGGTFNNGAFKASGIRFLMSATSTTRTAISISSTASTGAIGTPLWLTDLTFADTSSAATWANEILINQLPNIVFIDHVNGRFSSGATGTHILVEGDSTSYTTSVYIDDVTFIRGSGVVLGDYLQGIHVKNLNCLSCLNSLIYTPANGAGQEVELSNSSLEGYINIAPSGAGTIADLRIHDNYIYPTNATTSPSTSLVTISGVSALIMHDDIFSGTSSVASVSGLSLSGTVYPASISHEIFTGFANGGTGLLVNNAYTAPFLFRGLVFANNTNNISDTGTTVNTYVETQINGAIYPLGYGQSLTAAGQARIDQSATLGLTLTGWGSSNDFTFAGHNGTTVCNLRTNFGGISCLGYLIAGNGAYALANNSPTSVSGFSTSTPDVISKLNGSVAWTDTVGSTPVSTSAVFTVLTGYQTNGLTCGAYDQTTPGIVISQTGQSATTATFTSYSRTTGVATLPTAGDVIQIGPCVGH